MLYYKDETRGDLLKLIQLGLEVYHNYSEIKTNYELVEDPKTLTIIFRKVGEKSTLDQPSIKPQDVINIKLDL